MANGMVLKLFIFGYSLWQGKILLCAMGGWFVPLTLCASRYVLEPNGAHCGNMKAYGPGGLWKQCRVWWSPDDRTTHHNRSFNDICWPSQPAMVCSSLFLLSLSLSLSLSFKVEIIDLVRRKQPASHSEKDAVSILDVWVIIYSF